MPLGQVLAYRVSGCLRREKAWRRSIAGRELSLEREVLVEEGELMNLRGGGSFSGYPEGSWGVKKEEELYGLGVISS